MSEKGKSIKELVEEEKKKLPRLRVEKFNCPHCGKEIEISLAVGVKSEKPK